MQTITFEGCDHIIMSPEDFEALKKDAARWRYARRFIAVSEVRDWPKWAGRGHIESFEETCATERAIDATMGKD